MQTITEPIRNKNSQENDDGPEGGAFTGSLAAYTHYSVEMNFENELGNVNTILLERHRNGVVLDYVEAQGPYKTFTLAVDLTTLEEHDVVTVEALEAFRDREDSLWYDFLQNNCKRVMHRFVCQVLGLHHYKNYEDFRDAMQSEFVRRGLGIDI